MRRREVAMETSPAVAIQGKYDVIQVQMTKVVDRDCGLIPMMNGHGKETGLVPLSKEEKQQEDQMTIKLQVLQEQSLQPLKEDLSEWLAKTLNIDITAETFMDVLDNGVCLCNLAKVIQQKAEECVSNGTYTEPIPHKSPKCKINAPSGSWFARDNAANFLSWCQSHGMKQDSMFETEYLVSQTDQKSVINCLLEVARIGYKFGLEPPSTCIIKMETEIEEEEEIPVTKPVEIVRPLSNKVPNLDAEEGDDEIVTSCWNEIEQQCEAYKPSAIKQGQQSSGWKVIRVFVSSTFTDFFNEREILVKKVFPEIREWCSTRHIHLIECDLRWGVPREATTQDIISTCFEELNRCHKETDGQPFFLGLLGKRFGWIPGKEDLSDEIKQKFQWVINTSITFMEILHGAYRCKSPNAMFFLRSDDIVKSLPEPSLKRFVDKEPINQHHILELKKKIKSRFPDQFYEYNCKVDGTTDVTGKEKVKLSELDQFSEKVTEFFKTAITNMYGDNNSGKFDEEDMERENQRLYIENKSELVVGQDQLLETLKSYLQGEPLKDVTVSKKSKAFVRDPEFWGEPLDEDNMILCLKGHPGFGKSTLLSKVVGDSIKEGYDIFYHFVGCSASSKNTEFMYTRLLRALEERIHGEKDKENKPKENSLKDLMTRMKELLPKLREQQTKLIIILDAVNELPDSDTYNHLSWLPPRLPGNIKCIISSADDNPPTIARLTEHTCYICEVGPITKEAAELIVTHSLNKFNKKLDSDQLSLIVSRPCATNPLWLKILSEELRIFGDFRTLDMKIDQISDSVESLLTEIIGRLISEDNTGLVKKALYLLVCSIGGIKTQDLCNMLGDINNKEPVAPLYWSQTRRVLKPYIKEIGIEGNISFYHMEIYKSVSQVLLGKQNSRTEWYKILAMYYTKWCPDQWSRALYAPRYCMNANLKSELVDFFTNDAASLHVSPYERSQYFQNIKCRSLTHSFIPVVICLFCSNKKDRCVVCKDRLFFSKITAILCPFHGSSHIRARCLYCGRGILLKNGRVETYMGTIGKLCMHCGSGFKGKSCAMLLTE